MFSRSRVFVILDRSCYLPGQQLNALIKVYYNGKDDLELSGNIKRDFFLRYTKEKYGTGECYEVTKWDDGSVANLEFEMLGQVQRLGLGLYLQEIKACCILPIGAPQSILEFKQGERVIRSLYILDVEIRAGEKKLLSSKMPVCIGIEPSPNLFEALTTTFKNEPFIAKKFPFEFRIEARSAAFKKHEPIEFTIFVENGHRIINGIKAYLMEEVNINYPLEETKKASAIHEDAIKPWDKSSIKFKLPHFHYDHRPSVKDTRFRIRHFLRIRFKMGLFRKDYVFDVPVIIYQGATEQREIFDNKGCLQSSTKV